MVGAIDFLRASRDICKDRGTDCDGCPVLKFCMRAPERMTDKETTEIVRSVMAQKRKAESEEE